MSWLSDYDVAYNFRCTEGHTTQLIQSVKLDRPDTIQCSSCFAMAAYHGFDPVELKQTTKIDFEQNGRRAVAIKDATGKTRYISKTKEHYMKTGKIKHHYTKGYEEHLKKTEQHNMLDYESKKSKGTASGVKFKDLPDGEFVSDGKNFYPAPKGMK